MDQDELGNYLLSLTDKSYEIFTKSQNHEEYESAILIHINLLESTVIILDEISSDQKQLNKTISRRVDEFGLSHLQMFSDILTMS